MSDVIHSLTLRRSAGDVERDLSACRTLPTSAVGSSCVRPLPLTMRPPVGFRSSLARHLELAERLIVDRTAYVDLIADAVVRRQVAVRETAASTDSTRRDP